MRSRSFILVPIDFSYMTSGNPVFQLKKLVAVQQAYSIQYSMYYIGLLQYILQYTTVYYSIYYSICYSILQYIVQYIIVYILLRYSIVQYGNCENPTVHLLLQQFCSTNSVVFVCYFSAEHVKHFLLPPQPEKCCAPI